MQPDLLPHDSPPDAGLDAASSGDPAQATVLVVDLDGTLCRTDTLHEALLALLTAKPAMLPGIFRGLLEGKAAFKARVADLYVVPATQLPLNEFQPPIIARSRPLQPIADFSKRPWGPDPPWP